jgi:hypothetical protein
MNFLRIHLEYVHTVDIYIPLTVARSAAAQKLVGFFDVAPRIATELLVLPGSRIIVFSNKLQPPGVPNARNTDISWLQPSNAAPTHAS